MNYFKKVDTFLINLKCLFTATVLVIVSVNSAQAEDIEIYGNLVPSVSKPNVLFILDTSISMEEGESQELSKPDYDPSINYAGDSFPVGINPGSNVYIYTTSLSYTGMHVPATVNKCNEASDYFTENAHFPQFRTKPLLWEYFNTNSTETVCTSDQALEPLTQEVVARNNIYNVIGEWTVSEGNEYQLSVNTGSTLGRVRVYYSNNGERGDRICNKLTRGGITYCPSGTVPDDVDAIEVTYRNYRDDNSGITANLVILAGCSTQQVSDERADWQTEVEIDNLDKVVALECEADAGIHGLTEDSGEHYPQKEASYTDLDKPNYVADDSEPTAVNWSSSAIPERYLIPQNYHDYLQASQRELLVASGITINDGTGRDMRTYCQSRSRGGKYYSQGEGEDEVIFYCEPRMESLKKAMRNTLSTMSGANVGLMQFNSPHGALISAMRDIDDTDTVYYAIDKDGNEDTTKPITGRQDLINDMMAVATSGSTPLEGTFYEAYLYFAGKEIENSGGLAVADPRNSTEYLPDDQNIYTGITDPLGIEIDPASGEEHYKSPIQKYCQDNNVVLFSDGDSNDNAETKIEDFVGDDSCDLHGGCLPALAYGLANLKVNEDFDNFNNAYTYTIAFGDEAGTEDLEKTSNKGLRPGSLLGSQAKQASDATGLTTQFQEILSSIKQVDSDSFVAPAVSVNAFNRISNNDDLYYALFKPANNPRWSGNVKKYKLSPEAKILDANGSEAIDPATGYFVKTAQSYWSKVVDGLDVAKGGFAEQLDFTTSPRNLYAITKPASDNTGNEPESLTEDNFLDQVDRITRNEDGSVSTDGTDIPLGAISVPDLDENREKIRQWTLGKDIEQDLGGEATAPNYYVGDSLHSTPSVISFGTKKGTPKSVIFTATNQGMLHAIDARNGKELWSYIPDPDLFKNLGAYFNRQAGDPHVYGLDGEMLFDIERNGQLVSSDDLKPITKADLFMGQRRGGSKYFAIDVSGTLPSDVVAESGNNLDILLQADGNTQRKPVERKWTISPSTVFTDGTGASIMPFDRLGQTWAKPVPASLSCSFLGLANCDYKDVLVLAGGYDAEKYDDDNLVSSVIAASPAKGNEIYIVDRETGDFLWKASSSSFPDETTPDATINNKLIHSFPSAPTVVDADFNGTADLLFAADISGQIWRFDFRGSTISSTTGGVIADLSTGSDINANTSRRFYNRLSVSLSPTLRDNDNKIIDTSKFNIVLGSGYRAHPLSEEKYPEGDANAVETGNRLYVVYDRNIQFPQLEVDAAGDLTGDVTYKYTTNNETIDSDNIPAIGVSGMDISGSHYHGFHVALSDQYEKVLNPAVTNNYKIVSVTYTPSNSSDLDGSEACNKGVGQSRLYVTDLLTGDSKTTVLQKPGLSAEPVVIQIPDSNTGKPKKVVCVATECSAASGDTTDLSASDPEIGLGESLNGQLIKKSWWEEIR